MICGRFCFCMVYQGLSRYIYKYCYFIFCYRAFFVNMYCAYAYPTRHFSWVYVYITHDNHMYVYTLCTDLHVDRWNSTDTRWPFLDVAGFWPKRSRVHISARQLFSVFENDGHVTDPTSSWCLVLGLVRFRFVESWMARWRSFPYKGLVG